MTDAETTRRLTDWFRHWRSPLRRYLVGKSAVPVADLEDVSQEVFLRLLRYDQIELVRHPQAYLFKMAANVAAEWSIRARSRFPHDSKWLADLLTEDVPQEEAARASTQQEVERAINTLPSRHREVLRLQFGEGLDHVRIAARLGLTPRVVKRCISKSYEKLRTQLNFESLGAVGHGRE